MPIGQIGQGLLSSFANYVTGERTRQREMEDKELEYQRSIIEGLIKRPDINTAHLGRALTDLANLSASKPRAQKSGKAGFYGETHMPLSDLLSGLQSGLMPAMGDTQELVPAGSNEQAGMIQAPMKTSLDLGEYGTYSDGLPPAPMPAPNLPRMQYEMQPARRQPLLRSSNDMAREKAENAVLGKGVEVAGAIDRAHQYLSDPLDIEMATSAALGVPTGFLGTTVRQYNDPLNPGQLFPGLPLKNGGIMNLNTGQVVPGAQMAAYPTSRPPQAVELASMELFNTPDVRSLSQDQHAQLRAFVNSDRFVEFARRMNYLTQLQVAREWASPLTIQGTDPTTGQAATYVQSAGAAGGRGIGMPAVPPSPTAGQFAPPTNPAVHPLPAPPATPQLPGAQPYPTAVPQNKSGAAIPPAPNAQAGGPVRTPSGGILAAPTADMRNQAIALEPVTEEFGKLEGMIVGLNRRSGMAGMAIGMAKRGAGRLGANDPALDYMKAVDGMLATYARIAGERGVLVEGDIERARSLLPKLGESPIITRNALTRFKAFLEERLGVLPTPYRPGTGFDTTYRGGRASGAGPAGQSMRRPIPGTDQYAISTDGGKTWVAE